MPSKVVLFGAFDRHNFGDLLFPHIVSKHLPNQAVEFAGLADRDMRPWGGHLVKSLASIHLDENTTLIHCGGELLTCTAYQAAVMLQTPEKAKQAIAQYDHEPEAARQWVGQVLHTQRRIPYVAQTEMGKLIFNAVGGVNWPLLDAAQQKEAIAALKQADWVSVRDHVTQAYLQAVGVTASLCPDPAVMVKECFDEVIKQHSRQGEVAETIRKFPKGYIACQFSAEFGDDETLDQLVKGLDRTCAETGLSVVLFRAGAAPWHDRLEPYKRLSARMPAGSVRIFQSLHLWDICALIASSRAFCGSSLHGSIVAMAYGLPHVSLLAPQHISRPGKVAAYLETWEPEGLSCCVTVDAFARMLQDVLARSNEAWLKTAEHLAGLFRQNQQQWMSISG
jgi:hypothetical protein